MAVACTFSKPGSYCPYCPLSDAFSHTTPYLLHQSLLSLPSSPQVMAVGCALGWALPCAPCPVGCPTGAVLLEWLGWGGQVCPRLAFRGCATVHRSNARQWLVHFFLVTSPSLPSTSSSPGWLASLPSTTFRTDSSLTLPTCDEHKPDAPGLVCLGLGWLVGFVHFWFWGVFWLLCFVCFFSKAHCCDCILMQAVFDGFRGIRTLKCVTSLLLSKPQSHEQGIFRACQLVPDCKKANW